MTGVKSICVLLLALALTIEAYSISPVYQKAPIRGGRGQKYTGNVGSSGNFGRHQARPAYVPGGHRQHVSRPQTLPAYIPGKGQQHVSRPQTFPAFNSGGRFTQKRPVVHAPVRKYPQVKPTRYYQGSYGR